MKIISREYFANLVALKNRCSPVCNTLIFSKFAKKDKAFAISFAAHIKLQVA